MTTIPHTAVEVENKQITIDAEVLAPKLGLTVKALRDNMANGRVMSAVEAGEAEDAGRTRITFRYGTRVWRVVIEADGGLREDPLPVLKNKPVANIVRLLDLADLAKSRAS